MPTTVDIPEIGTVEFPEGMSAADISNEIPKLIQRHSAQQGLAGVAEAINLSDTARRATEVGLAAPSLPDVGTPLKPESSRTIPSTAPATAGGEPLHLPDANVALSSAASDIAEQFGEIVTHPSPIPTPFPNISKDENPFIAAGKEVVNLAVGIPQFFTTTPGILAAGAGAAAPTVVSGLFTADLLKTLGKQVHDTYDNWSKMTPAEKTVAVTDIIGTGTMGLLTAGHTVKGAQAFSESYIPRGTGISPELKLLAPQTAAAVEQTTTGAPNASSITSTTRIPSEQVRPGMDEAASLRQQRQAAPARPLEEVPKVQEAAQAETPAAADVVNAAHDVGTETPPTPPQTASAGTEATKPRAEMTPREVLAAATSEQEPMSVLRQHYVEIMEAFRQRQPINMEAARKYEPDVEGVKDLGQWLYERGYRADQKTGNWRYFGEAEKAKAAERYPVPKPEQLARNRWSQMSDSELASRSGAMLEFIRGKREKNEPIVTEVLDNLKAAYTEAKRRGGPVNAEMEAFIKTPSPTSEPAPPQAAAVGTEATKPAVDWDTLYEDLVGNLDSFAPARSTGVRNYELNDVAQRFVDYAKADTSGKPLTELVSDFAKTDEASAAQIRKLKAAVKDVAPTAKKSAKTESTPHSLATQTGLTYDAGMESMLPADQWHFTDNRPDSPTRSFSVVVPKGSTAEQVQKALEGKLPAKKETNPELENKYSQIALEESKQADDALASGDHDFAASRARNAARAHEGAAKKLQFQRTLASNNYEQMKQIPEIEKAVAFHLEQAEKYKAIAREQKAASSPHTAQPGGEKLKTGGRSTYADGRWIPITGDEVYKVSPDGSIARGKIVEKLGMQRVETGGKSVLYGPQWTVVNDPIKPLSSVGPVTTKEPWQMTKFEFRSSQIKGQPEHIVRNQANLARDFELHKELVADAILEGKPVPPEVLRDYPDLRPNAQGRSAEQPTKPIVGEPAPLKPLTISEALALAERRKTEGKSQLSVAQELSAAGLSDGDATGIAAQVFKPTPAAQVAGEKKIDYSDWESKQQVKGVWGGSHRLIKRQQQAFDDAGIPWSNRGSHTLGSRRQTVLIPNTPEAIALLKKVGGSVTKDQWEHLTKDKLGYPPPQEVGQPAPQPEGPVIGQGPGGMTNPKTATESPETFEGTALKNAVADLERASLGLPEATKADKREMANSWNQAQDLISKDPGLPTRILNELRDDPRRGITDVESAVLLRHKVGIMNALNSAAESTFSGKTPEARAEAGVQAARLSDELLDFLDTVKSRGTQWGREGRWRQVMANDDFSLSTMVTRKRAALGGRELTEAEMSQIKSLHDQVSKLEAQLVEAEKKSKAQTDAAEQALKDALADIQNKTRQEQPAYHPRVLRAAERFATYMDSKASAALERIRQKMSHPGATSVLDPTLIDDLAIVGAAKITRGIVDAAKWADSMRKEIGDWIVPHLDAIRKAADAKFESETASLEQKIGKPMAERVKKSISKMDVAERQADLTSKIKSKSDEGKLNEISPLVRKLARSFVEQGIRERDPLIDAVHGVLKEIDPKITRRQAMDAISGYGDFKQLTKDEISVKLRDLKGQMQQVAKLEDMQSGQPPLKTGLERRIPSPEESRLIKLVNQAKNEFQIPISDEATQLKSSLDTLKTRMQNKITELEGMIARKEYAKRPRREIKLDDAALRLREQLYRTRREFNRGLIADRLAQRPLFEKAQDTFLRWYRGGILSSPLVFGKLTAAAAMRAVLTPMEEFIGAGFSKVLPRLAARAPREGYWNSHAEARAIRRGLTEGIPDAWSILKTGESQLDVLYGKGREGAVGESQVRPFSIADLPGRTHGAFKATTKRAEFERAYEKILTWYGRNGSDISNPGIQLQAAIEAYKHANRSIFLQDNRLVSAYNSALTRLQQTSKTTGVTPVGGRLAATTAKVLLPIVRVPSNIVAEVFQFAFGSLSGSARLAKAYARGIETLPTEQADLIMRELKKGSIGGAALLAGYFLPQIWGGLYVPGEKKKAGEIKPGEARIPGVEIPSFMGGPDVPKWALHNPLSEVFQTGATISRIVDDPKHGGYGKAVTASVLGLAELNPMVKEMADVHRLFDPKQNVGYSAETLRSIFVPQGVQWTAKQLDTDAAGNTVERKPKTFVQHLEMGIPGLRQNVPPKHATSTTPH